VSTMAIKDFLADHNLNVYLAVFDKTVFTFVRNCLVISQATSAIITSRNKWTGVVNCLILSVNTSKMSFRKIISGVMANNSIETKKRG